MTPRHSMRKVLRGSSACMTLVLLIAAGCTQEVGGDGFQPKPTSNGASVGTAGALATGGTATNGGAPEGGAPDQTSGKGGTSAGGHATGGGVTMPEAGASGAGGDTGTKSVCGNNIVEPGEECDDGNTKSGDGCSADCKKNCEVCEQTFCKAVLSGDAGEFNYNGDPGPVHDAVTNCFNMPNNADAGPGVGVARKELCQAAVDCAKERQCAQFESPNLPTPLLKDAARVAFMHCFCTRDTTLHGNYTAECGDHSNYQLNHVPYYKGECKNEFQEAAESDTEAGVFATIKNNAKPLGAANLLLLYCDLTLCPEECTPDATIGTVAQISADILATPNDVGESALGDLIADSQRAAAGTDFAFVNPTAYIHDLSSPGLIYHAAPGRSADADGRVLESEVRQVLFGMDPGGGYNNDSGTQLVTFQLTGEAIYTLLEAIDAIQVSGLTYTRTTLKHVAEVRKDGTLLDKTKVYTITASDAFLNSELFDAKTTATGKLPEKEFLSYLQKQTQPIAPPTLNRITLLPPTCDDGFWDGNEVGLDTCPTVTPTCNLATHKCQVSCDNNLQDGDETGVDVCPTAHPTCNHTSHLCE